MWAQRLRPRQTDGPVSAVPEDGPQCGYAVIEILRKPGWRAEWREFAAMVTGFLEGRACPSAA